MIFTKSGFCPTVSKGCGRRRRQTQAESTSGSGKKQLAVETGRDVVGGKTRHFRECRHGRPTAKDRHADRDLTNRGWLSGQPSFH